MANTFEIEDKLVLSTLAGTEKYLVQRADGTYRHVLGSTIATQGFVNTVFVSSIADFPTAVAGVITLDNDTVYILLASISTSSRFVLPPRSGLSALDFGVATLTYTGALTCFTGAAIDSWYIHEIAVFATNAASVLFDITGAPVNFPAFCIMETISYIGFGNLGTMAGCSFRLGNTGFINFGQGLSITGSIVLQITGGLYTNVVAATTPFLTFSGTHDLIQVKDCNMDVVPTEEVIFIDPAIILTEAVISGNVYRNGTSDWFGVGSLTENDVRFEYSENGDGPESDETGNILISASAGTVIGTPGTFVMINGTYTAETTKRFTHSAGVLTYIGRKSRTFGLMASISFISSSNNREVDVRVAKNGVSDANSNQRRKIGAGADVGNISVLHELDLVTGDTVELQWSTAASTSTLTATFMNFIIS